MVIIEQTFSSLAAVLSREFLFSNPIFLKIKKNGRSFGGGIEYVIGGDPSYVYLVRTVGDLLQEKK